MEMLTLSAAAVVLLLLVAVVLLYRLCMTADAVLERLEDMEVDAADQVASEAPMAQPRGAGGGGRR